MGESKVGLVGGLARRVAGSARFVAAPAERRWVSAGREAPPAEARTRRAGIWADSRAVVICLLVVTLAGGLVRGFELSSPATTMGRDASRLALAAQGILEQGVPRLPGGLVYTRGLVPAYLEALSFARFGRNDLAAKLPSLLAGTLLVPAVYLLARGLAGPGMALAAAAIVSFSPPLVAESRVAWMNAHLLLWVVVALALVLRARRRRSVADRALAAIATAAALFSHELAIQLLPIIALYDLLVFGPLLAPWSRGRRVVGGDGAARALAWRQLAAYWPMVLLTAAVLARLSLALRAPTLGGAMAEFREFLHLRLEPGGLTGVLGTLFDWHPWLLPAALLGLPLRRPTRSPSTLLYLALLVMLVSHGFILIEGDKPRYIVLALPVLVTASAYGTARAATIVSRLLSSAGSLARIRTVAGGAALVALVASSLDLEGVRKEIYAAFAAPTPLQLMADRDPDDLIMSYGPTITTFYFGRTDFWIRPRAYSKYVWAGTPPLYDVHTGATLVRNRKELEQFVFALHANRRLWVILDPAKSYSPEIREVVGILTDRGAKVRRTGDGRLVLHVQL